MLAGGIPPSGIVEKLATIEAMRTTGVLRWRGSTTGEVVLTCGQIAADQPDRDDGADPVELLLAERQGSFEIFQRLPALPVSKGDASHRRGSLEVHVAADLMNYCEAAGLTGLLVLEHDGMRVEIGYDKGELSDIRLDGLAELNDVFGWEDGSFGVFALAHLPDLAEDLDEAVTTELIRPDLAELTEVPETGQADATGKQLLRVVEVTLAEILREREERRPATRTSPPRPAPPAPAKHPTLPPQRAPSPPPSRREPTVRVIYLKGEATVAKDEGVRHVQGSREREDVLPEAAPARRSRSEEEPDVAKKTKKSGGPPAKTEKKQAESAADTRPKSAVDPEAATVAAAAVSSELARATAPNDAKSTKDAGEARASAATKGSHDAAPPASETPKGLPTALWVLISLTIVIASLALLAALPSLD